MSEKKDERVSFKAMNIVNQIFDRVSVWLPENLRTDFVKFRQANNDELDTFVESFFVDLQNEICVLRAEHAALKDEWIPINSDDDLPEDYKTRFLWQDRLGKIEIGRRLIKAGAVLMDDDVWRAESTFVAYRPLPEPYQKEIEK